MDVRPILRVVGKSNETGRYQLVATDKNTYVLDTQQGKYYTSIVVDGKARFVLLDPLVGEVHDIGLKLSK
jgi:hypothetical protein